MRYGKFCAMDNIPYLNFHIIINQHSDRDKEWGEGGNMYCDNNDKMYFDNFFFPVYFYNFCFLVTF